MKYLVTQVLTRAGAPGQMLALNEAAKAWADARLSDGTFDCVHSYLDGNVFAIVNAESHDALMSLLTEYPLYWHMDWRVEPLCHWTRRIDKVLDLQRQQAS